MWRWRLRYTRWLPSGKKNTGGHPTGTVGHSRSGWRGSRETEGRATRAGWEDGEKWSVGVEGGGNKADHTYGRDRPAEPSFQYPEQSLVNSAHIYSLIHSESGNEEAHSHGIKFPIVEEGK